MNTLSQSFFVISKEPLGFEKRRCYEKRGVVMSKETCKTAINTLIHPYTHPLMRLPHIRALYTRKRAQHSTAEKQLA